MLEIKNNIFVSGLLLDNRIYHMYKDQRGKFTNHLLKSIINFSVKFQLKVFFNLFETNCNKKEKQYLVYKIHVHFVLFLLQFSTLL